jgi:hypothetical protein
MTASFPQNFILTNNGGFYHNGRSARIEKKLLVNYVQRK